ncbi:DUF3592 domain-containing protein [Pseudarthrobacter sp. PS3-L1]|uniref:DUF3592 domain-containing protein n=1 Tax=Pseudarthrobacter sp. PS3-L1 TaxID=3046207 RepID=UPI0024BB01AE|nr:DUF3592 domain-containing protein [Pseudarthrobacter sp. PS3-L1]MDJ0320769.1 DUF3592 domain-containing protein [Pseudarthrobacter sp. PS3-L1]
MKTILYVVWAVFFLCAAAAFMVTTRKARTRDQQAATWPRIQATVTGHVGGWTNGGGGSTRNRRYFATYQFTDPAGTVVAGKSDVSKAAAPIQGSFIEVSYNPADPKQSFQNAGQTKLLVGCLLPLFAAFAVASLYLISVFPA